MTERSDRVFLGHMMEEITFILDQTADRTRTSFLSDEVLQRAVVRSLEIIGEATKNLSDELRDNYPDVDWHRIAGLRDMLIHQYFGVNWDIVWDVIQTKLPALQHQLLGIIQEEENHI